MQSHTRRALEASCSPDELRHEGVLAITTIGFPSTMAVMSWVEEFFERRIARKSPNRSSTALQKREATGKKSWQAIWPHAPETKSTAPPPEDQHPISEMESLTEEDKNRGRERNGSRPNRQPKQGLFAVYSLN